MTTKHPAWTDLRTWQNEERTTYVTLDHDGLHIATRDGHTDMWGPPETLTLTTVSDEETQPTVVLIIGQSAITRDAYGEIIETVEYDEAGTPLWRDAGICDHRGAGGAEGFRLLAAALDAAEENARLAGLTIERLDGPLTRDDIVRQIANAVRAAEYRARDFGGTPDIAALAAEYVAAARDTLDRLGVRWPGTTPEGERFVADAVTDGIRDGFLRSETGIASDLYDTLTAE